MTVRGFGHGAALVWNTAAKYFVRKKAENMARDQYGRLYASVLAVEELLNFIGKRSYTTVTVEAEDMPEWDDIVQHRQNQTVSRHQVKRQQTDLSRLEFQTCVSAAIKDTSETKYHFAFPHPVGVSGVGEMRFLRTLCDRVRQSGAHLARIIKGARPDERRWIDFLKEITKLSEKVCVSRLHRLHIDSIGFEEELDKRALRSLSLLVDGDPSEAWRKIKDYIGRVDGAVEIKPKMLQRMLPGIKKNPVNVFYASFVEEVELSFCLNTWDGLSDHLVRNFVWVRFREGVLKFVESVDGAAWPRRYPDLERAIQNLADRSHDYINYFDRRSEFRNNEWLGENIDYKRIRPNPNFVKERAIAKRWDRGVQIRLSNMVVALNEFFKAVRQSVQPSYRLRNGKLGILDSLGFRHGTESKITYPKAYIEVR